jgi:katanin p60 ATPase-containing subunit A1
VCKEAAMQPLRRLMTLLEDKEEVVPEDGMWLQLYDPF